MDLDDQLRRYFGTSDLSDISTSGQDAGLERARVDFWAGEGPSQAVCPLDAALHAGCCA